MKTDFSVKFFLVSLFLIMTHFSFSQRIQKDTIPGQLCYKSIGNIKINTIGYVVFEKGKYFWDYVYSNDKSGYFGVFYDGSSLKKGYYVQFLNYKKEPVNNISFFISQEIK